MVSQWRFCVNELMIFNINLFIFQSIWWNYFVRFIEWIFQKTWRCFIFSIYKVFLIKSFWSSRPQRPFFCISISNHRASSEFALLRISTAHENLRFSNVMLMRSSLYFRNISSIFAISNPLAAIAERLSHSILG